MTALAQRAPEVKRGHGQRGDDRGRDQENRDIRQGADFGLVPGQDPDRPGQGEGERQVHAVREEPEPLGGGLQDERGGRSFHRGRLPYPAHLGNKKAALRAAFSGRRKRKLSP